MSPQCRVGFRQLLVLSFEKKYKAPGGSARSFNATFARDAITIIFADNPQPVYIDGKEIDTVYIPDFTSSSFFAAQFSSRCVVIRLKKKAFKTVSKRLAEYSGNEAFELKHGGDSKFLVIGAIRPDDNDKRKDLF